MRRPSFKQPSLFDSVFLWGEPLGVFLLAPMCPIEKVTLWLLVIVVDL